VLFDMNENEITHLPHQEDYDRWRANLSNADYQGIIDELHLIFEKAGQEDKPVRASYIPGKNWEGTVYQPIYHACGDNFDIAKLFFGLLVWEAAQSHDKKWVFIREDKGTDDKPFGLTYFRR